MADLDKLITILNQTRLQTSNNPLYQVLLSLIQTAQKFQRQSTIVAGGNSAEIAVLKSRTYLTAVSEVASLPNSRQLLAGTNVAFDDTTPGQRTVNVTGGSGIDYVVLSNGDPTGPTPVDDGNGGFIYIPYVAP